MTKFFGKVGYAETVKTAPGVYSEQIVERPYYGDVTKTSRRLEGSDSVNDKITCSNKISIVADAYAYEHFFAVRYVIWAGCRWKVPTIEVQRPRLILTLGGVYNDDEGSEDISSN